MSKEQEIREELKKIYDPELKRNIVELQMVRDIAVTDGRVQLTLALTTLRCPLKEKFVLDSKQTLSRIPGISSVEVKLTEMGKEELGRLFPKHPLVGINKVKHFIAVGSGKGGGERLSNETWIPLLGSVPVDMEIRQGGDEGVSLMVSSAESETGRVFQGIAKRVAEHE